jgi:hypothetical protein
LWREAREVVCALAGIDLDCFREKNEGAAGDAALIVLLGIVLLQAESLAGLKTVRDFVPNKKPG